MAAWAIVVKADPGCDRATEADMALGNSTGPRHYSGPGWQTGHQPTPHYIHVAPSASVHSTQTILLLSVSHFDTIYLLIISTLKVLGGPVDVFSPAQALRTQAGL